MADEWRSRPSKRVNDSSSAGQRQSRWATAAPLRVILQDDEGTDLKGGERCQRNARYGAPMSAVGLPIIDCHKADRTYKPTPRFRSRIGPDIDVADNRS
jgi:hypothetical protein